MPQCIGLSLKCTLYGDRPHTPCSGTCDCGAGHRCIHWCHRQAETREWWWLPLIISVYVLVALASYVMVSLAIQITP